MLTFKKDTIIAFLICSVFFILYCLLSIIRHLHFGSFGYDLGIADQVVWEYSRFHSPITTIQFYPFTSLLSDHIELIYVILAPFYWIFNSAITLLILQAFFISFSGLPMYNLAKKRNISSLIGLSLMTSYLVFYGVQNAIWFDVHSLVFGASFLPWFIYSLDNNNLRLAPEVKKPLPQR